VNLLDNGETIYRLKRYTVLTLIYNFQWMHLVVLTVHISLLKTITTQQLIKVCNFK
jgi:hypothetical protein